MTRHQTDANISLWAKREPQFEGKPPSRLSLFSDTFHFAEICILIGSTLGQYHRYWKIHILTEISIISISLKVSGDKANPSLFKDNTLKEHRGSPIYQF